MTQVAHADDVALLIRRLKFIEQKMALTREYRDALEEDETDGPTLDRLPQLQELLDGYLKLMEEQESDIRVLIDSEAVRHDRRSCHRTGG